MEMAVGCGGDGGGAGGGKGGEGETEAIPPPPPPPPTHAARLQAAPAKSVRQNCFWVILLLPLQ